MNSKSSKAYFRYFSVFPMLAVLLMPYILLVAFLVHQAAIRHSVKERIERTHLVKLELRENAFEWVRKGKEIRVNKRMFDIKKIEINGEILTFYGIYDDEETELVEHWVALQQNGREGTFFHQIERSFLIFGKSLQTETIQIFSPVALRVCLYHAKNFLHTSKGFTAKLLRPPSPSLPCL